MMSVTNHPPVKYTSSNDPSASRGHPEHVKSAKFLWRLDFRPDPAADLTALSQTSGWWEEAGYSSLRTPPRTRS